MNKEKQILIGLTESEANYIASLIQNDLENGEFEFDCEYDKCKEIKDRIEQQIEDKIERICLTEGQLKLLVAAGCPVTKDQLGKLIECAKSMSWREGAPDADYPKESEDLFGDYLGEQNVKKATD